MKYIHKKDTVQRFQTDHYDNGDQLNVFATAKPIKSDFIAQSVLAIQTLKEGPKVN